MPDAASPPAPAPRARVATTAADVTTVARALAGTARMAFDLESNGLFAYRACVCTLQLGSAANGTTAALPPPAPYQLEEVMIIDALQAPLAPLSELLSDRGPVKVVHDVAFDARMLAEVGISLGNCHDTAIAARMLGKTATGLGSLLASELGVTVDKSMQQHDWSRRPFDDRALGYLALDVAHLEALDDVIWAAVRAAGIEDEVLEETRYRLGTAISAAKTPDLRPAWVRIKGIDRLGQAELAILRRVAELREKEAARLDVAPYKVIGNEVLIAIAKARPRTLDELRKVRGAMQGPRAHGMAKEMLSAAVAGITDGTVPEVERVWLDKPRVPPMVAKARRQRESRIMAWRKSEAATRGVDEQAVLPGHCVKVLGDADTTTLDDVARVPGIGEFRARRYGEAILKALTEGPVADPKGAASVEPEHADE